MSDQPPTSKPHSDRSDALVVLQQLRRAGHEAYFAGGCVRDLLLGKNPSDYDVATSAPPGAVRSLFKNTQAVGAAFGVILVRTGASMIEVATFRTDGNYQDGRRPEQVVFSTAREDAGRRDFTINGLFLDPVNNQVIDHVGGQADLSAKLIRAIGNADQRFAEDHLRLLRAIRFAARLGFSIEESTALAIRQHAQKLIRISPERIADELRRMLTPTTRNVALDALEDFGITAVLLRFLPEARLPPTPRRFSLLQQIDQPLIPFGLALAAIVLEFRMRTIPAEPLPHWLAPPQLRASINAVRQSLKISNIEVDEMTGALAYHRLLQPVYPPVAQLKRFLMQPYSTEARWLIAALQRCGFMTDRIAKLLDDLRQISQTDFAPPPLITGDDLTAAGAAPGPRFKLALDAAYDAQLEKRIESKSQAMALAQRLLMQ